jgi:hypothetical protein
LDSDDYETREAALRELTQRGEPIALAVQEALRGNIPLEMRRRLEQLLKTLPNVPPPEEIQRLRAVQALELIGTAEARMLLESLAKGAAAARQTREAQEALARLAKRSGDAAAP